jgi:hypothetical protein
LERRRALEAKVEWSIDKLRLDMVEKLQEQLKVIVGVEFESKMFSSDFKNHVICCNKFINALKEEPDMVTQVLD